MNKGSFKNNGSKEPCGKIWGERISAYIDGELSQDERHEVEDHLRICPECRSFITTLERIKGVTMKMRFADPPDEIWKHYWTGIYNRIERGIGWIFFSIGLVILICYGLYHLLVGFFLDTDISLYLRIGVGFGIVGIIVLFVSIIREKIFRNKNERYKGVEL